MRCLVTGASGFVGGHVAQSLRGAGHPVRTVVRPSSDTSMLGCWGVETVEGDLTDKATLVRACAGVEVVVHCAAKVGETGSWDEYRKVNVEALGWLFDACPKTLNRFVLISSLGVYPAQDHNGTDESCPPPARHIDGYTQSKAEADGLSLERHRLTGVPLVVLRPGFVYGPRDRLVLPRILRNLKRGIVTYFGSPKKKLNQIYVGNIAHAVMQAIEKPNAIGQVYNLTDAECVTKEEFFNTIADLAGLARPSKRMPRWFGNLLCSTIGGLGSVLGFEPVITPARVKFMGLNLDYSIAKARRELDYNPSVGFPDGIRRTMDWLFAEGPAKAMGLTRPAAKDSRR